jgi:hypothetical protein
LRFGCGGRERVLFLLLTEGFPSGHTPIRA